MTVGVHMRALRRQRGLTLDELSGLCGVGGDDLGRYERGLAVPRPDTVRKIAQALDVSITVIREGMGWTEPSPAEGWETAGDDSLLRDGILENLKESYGPGFSLEEGEIHALMESVKASIPALIEHMKDTRSEDVVSREILEELKIAPEGGGEETRFELTDGQWEQLRDLFPPEKAGKGRAFKSNRLMLDGILYWMKSGVNWKDLPKKYGRYKCVSDRLRLWVRTGVWPPVIHRMLALHILEEDDVPVGLRERPENSDQNERTD